MPVSSASKAKTIDKNNTITCIIIINLDDLNCWPISDDLWPVSAQRLLYTTFIAKKSKICLSSALPWCLLKNADTVENDNEKVSKQKR